MKNSPFLRLVTGIFGMLACALTVYGESLNLPAKPKEHYEFDGKATLNGRPYTLKDKDGNKKEPSFFEETGALRPQGEYFKGDYSRERYSAQSLVIKGHFEKLSLFCRSGENSALGIHSPVKVRKGKLDVMFCNPEKENIERKRTFGNDLPDGELNTVVVVYDADTCWVACGDELTRFIDPVLLDKDMSYLSLDWYSSKYNDYITDFVFYDRALSVPEISQITGCEYPEIVDMNNYDYTKDGNVRKYMMYFAINLAITLLYLFLLVKWSRGVRLGWRPNWIVVTVVAASIAAFGIMFRGSGAAIGYRCASAGATLFLYLLLCILPRVVRDPDGGIDVNDAMGKAASAGKSYAGYALGAIAEAFSGNKVVKNTYVNGQLKKSEETMDMQGFAGKSVTAFLEIVFPLMLIVMAMWIIGNLVMNLIYFLPIVQFVISLIAWKKARNPQSANG